MSAEAIRLINAAISVTTGNTIDSVDDGSPEAIAADLHYENMAQAEITSSPWKFARKTGNCSALPTTPDSCEYSYAWQLPDDVLKLRTLWVNGLSIDYIIAADKVVWTRCADVPVAVFTYRAPESIWVPAFKTAFTKRLEALMLRVDEREDKAKDRDQDAERLFARARLIYSQEEATHQHKRYPLITARRIGNASLRR
jgi:hypothetical protein